MAAEGDCTCCPLWYNSKLLLVNVRITFCDVYKYFDKILTALSVLSTFLEVRYKAYSFEKLLKVNSTKFYFSGIFNVQRNSVLHHSSTIHSSRHNCYCFGKLCAMQVFSVRAFGHNQLTNRIKC